MSGPEPTDAELVARSQAGQRDAFGLIVARYQSLVCALAYNATGSLSQSEDLAQETFLAAWKQLRDIREPERLRAWLCGIARNLINNSFRRHQREPAHAAETLDVVQESSTPEPQPPEQTISREEEAILWRSLEKIPELYREPLILFYREQQSIAHVAAALELSEDAVKQRLSRGRKLLHDEVIAFVEGALRQTTPGRAFTFGVLAALPMFATSAKAATIGATAAKGTSLAASTALVTVLGSLLGPVVGLFGAYVGIRSSLAATRTPRERQFVIRQTKIMMAVMLAANVALGSFIFAAARHWRLHPVFFAITGAGLVIGITGFIVTMAVRYNRVFRRLREEEQLAHPEVFVLANTSSATVIREYRSRLTLLGLPLVHILNMQSSGQPMRSAVGWIAMGDRAYGVLFAAGGVSVGCFSMGGVAVGLIAMGGVSLGLLSLGGLAVGAIAIGGGAFGILAAGGLAMGWIGAEGGLAVAREFALGGQVLAQHANNLAAREYFARFPWMDLRNPFYRNLATLLIWLPLLFFAAVVWRVRKQRR